MSSPLPPSPPLSQFFVYTESLALLSRSALFSNAPAVADGDVVARARHPASHPAAPTQPASSAQPASTRASLAAGALAGLTSKLAVYPLDTVKKRLQMSGVVRASAYGPSYAYGGTLDALRTIAREEGVARGLYRGVAPSLLKAALSTALWFAVHNACAGALLALAPGVFAGADGGGGGRGSVH